MEVTLVNTMSRELVLREYINEVKSGYDYVLIIRGRESAYQNALPS